MGLVRLPTRVLTRGVVYILSFAYISVGVKVGLGWTLGLLFLFLGGLVEVRYWMEWAGMVGWDETLT